MTQLYIKPIDEYLAERKAWDMKRQAISRKNERLIKTWNAEKKPWWKFWDRGLSFEEKRSIILSNWEELSTPQGKGK